MKVLADFENGRQHTMVHIRLKGAYHVGVPLLADALCHPDGSRVRAASARAVRLWMSMTAEQRAAAHEKTQELMVGFLDDIIAISQGGGLIEDFPDLEIVVCRFVLPALMNTEQRLPTPS